MYSLSGEYVYDRLFLWGFKRIGFDLYRVGDYCIIDWYEKYMFDFKSVVLYSIMFVYKYLFIKKSDFDIVYVEVLI